MIQRFSSVPAAASIPRLKEAIADINSKLTDDAMKVRSWIVAALNYRMLHVWLQCLATYEATMLRYGSALLLIRSFQ